MIFKRVCHPPLVSLNQHLWNPAAAIACLYIGASWGFRGGSISWCQGGLALFSLWSQAKLQPSWERISRWVMFAGLPLLWPSLGGTALHADEELLKLRPRLLVDPTSSLRTPSRTHFRRDQSVTQWTEKYPYGQVFPRIRGFLVLKGFLVLFPCCVICLPARTRVHQPKLLRWGALANPTGTWQGEKLCWLWIPPPGFLPTINSLKFPFHVLKHRGSLGLDGYLIQDLS